ncbi:PREDICTED: uncharacterized protein LOC106905860 [Poecilia mexicana]|uniref:uncharacterized protein LOC106905860 n=1 Tax=Poecilia mexicana TaxID=48701 RepID=UPI00072DCA0F|nr:PREDICTED: uncharacterized protein LOC106905860 [Poecilia mexicana]
MSEAITELDLLRLLNTGISSLAPVTGVQPSLCVPCLGRSLSAYLASRMPSTPTRYATYGLQAPRTLCSDRSEIVLATLMRTIADVPWFSRTTMSTPATAQRSTTPAAVADKNSCSSVPSRRDHAATSPRWHKVRRERRVSISTPQWIKYTPTQKKAHTSANSNDSALQQVCNSSAAQSETKWRGDGEGESVLSALLLLLLASAVQPAHLTRAARTTESEPTHAALRTLWELQSLLNISLSHASQSGSLHRGVTRVFTYPLRSGAPKPFLRVLLCVPVVLQASVDIAITHGPI